MAKITKDDLIQKAFKFRIYPNKKQIEYFEECNRTSNFIYNYFLREQQDISEELTNLSIINKKDRYECMTINKLWFNKYKASRIITEISKTQQYSFLSIPDTTQRSYVIKALDSSFKNIKKSNSGFPNYKNKNSRFSFTGQLQYKNDKVLSLKINFSNEKNCLLTIPKVKNIKMVCHIDEFKNGWGDNSKIKINSYTISRVGEKYFISFQSEINKVYPEAKKISKNKTIGVDFGVIRTVTTSRQKDFNNKILNQNISILKDNLEELARLSKILNRKIDYHKKNKTGINFWETSSFKRIKNKISKLHYRISCIREYIQHNISNELIKLDNVDTIVLEKLNIKGMTKRSEKGKSNNKKGLNRSLNDVGLYSIRNKIEYKAKNVGKNVVLVDPKNTSRICSVCGYKHKTNRKTQKNFECGECGHKENADFNAAKNIKNRFINSLV